ncbi:hypothetical protein JW964_20115 [candidate division KSB1 bacterium]|nr:hypothetical protein [candidate division KSB1 bacterium]
MPECFPDKNIRGQAFRASIGLKKYGFPPKTCGNDRFVPPCERLRFFVYVHWFKV